MNIIGITGPTGAGKSLLCVELKKANIPCIDADKVYHSLLLPPSECLNALRRAFGDEIFSDDGKLDRAKLGAIVFNSPEKLELLNKTVLGNVLCEIRNIISDYKHKGFSTVAVDAPTLIESGFYKECSTVISVLASKETRLARIMERDSLTEEKAKLRINAQKSDEFYEEYSDIIIKNNGNQKQFKEEIESIIKTIG